MKAEKTKNYIIQYVIYTYGLFGLLLLTLGGIATVLLHSSFALLMTSSYSRPFDIWTEVIVMPFLR
jgi:hypothetical protein